jgi:hypothetical protein
MAEIKVEPKRSGLGWLWAIIILALIAAGVWYYMTTSRAAPATAAPADSTRTSLRLRSGQAGQALVVPHAWMTEASHG